MLELAFAHLDLRNNLFRVGLHFVDEYVLLQLAGSDLFEFPLPLGCQGRGFQFFRNQLQQLLAFGSDMDFLSASFDQEGIEQLLDDVGARSDGSQSTRLLQRLSQSFVRRLHIFRRIFHRRQQSRFIEVGRRFRLAGCLAYVTDSQHIVCLDFRQQLLLETVFRLLILRAIAVDFFPAGSDDRLAAGHKARAPDFCAQSQLLIFVSREKHSQEAFHNQVIDFEFLSRQLPYLDDLFRRDDGMVIGNFAVVDERLIRLDRFRQHLVHERTVFLDGAGFQSVRQRGYDVVRQVAGIRTRISQ